MADLSTTLIDKAFYKDYEIDQNRKKLEDIYGKYKKDIDKNSELSKIPVSVILSFIFIESAGKENAVSPANAYGLMQLTIPTAKETLWYEYTKDRLTNSEKEYMKELFGNRYTKLMNHLKLKQPSKIEITRDDLLNPRINLFLGTLYLGQLIDYFTEGNTIRIDKVIIAYNTGKYSKYTKIAKQEKGGVDSLISKLPKETANYIVKLVGKNGVLDTSIDVVST